jgi:polar amino acid transport system substrate-binding protein
MTIFPSNQEPRRGFIIDLFTKIYAQFGIDLIFFEVPLARGLQMVSDGQCDLLPEMAVNSESKDYVYAQQATFEYPMAFVIRQEETWSYDGIASLQQKRIATGSGWNYSSMSVAYQAYLDNPNNQANIETVSGEVDVVNRILWMIAKKRVDLYVDNIFLLEYLIHQLGLEKQLKLVNSNLKGLIEKPIFSLRLDNEKRIRLMRIWDEGIEKITIEEKKALLQAYGVRLPYSFEK